MFDFSDSIGVVGGIGGLIVLLSGALVYVRGSYTAARFDALRKDVMDYQAREELHTLQIKEMQITLEHLDQENRTLRELSTQRAAVEDLASKMDSRHREMIDCLEAIKVAIERSSDGS